MRNGLHAAIIAVGLSFGIVLGVAFAIPPGLVRMVSDQVFGIALAVALPCLSWMLLKVLYHGPGISIWPTRRTPEDVDPARAARIRQIKEQAKRDHADYQEFKRMRIAELDASPVPAKRKYARLVERGQSWTDSQIAYAEDPGSTATCGHLAPIELAMRKAGIATRLLTTPWRELTTLPSIEAKCCVNEADLRRRFALAESVRFEEGYQPERSEHDNPWATLQFQECGSSIQLIHSEWGRGQVPWFPF